MRQRHICRPTFRHAQRAAYRTAISAAQILVIFCYLIIRNAAASLVEIESRDRHSGADWAAWLPGTCQVGRLVRRPGGPPREMLKYISNSEFI